MDIQLAAAAVNLANVENARTAKDSTQLDAGVVLQRASIVTHPKNVVMDYKDVRMVIVKRVQLTSEIVVDRAVVRGNRGKLSINQRLVSK